MNISKKKISDLTLCYCIAPIMYKGQRHFLVASEKEYSCLLFDIHGKLVDEIWKGPGGTMSAVAVPGEDGAFLATHKFYSPNNCKEAKIVLCRHTEQGWQVRTLADMPYVHRFDIIQRNGVNYFIGCCIKNGYDYKDDWSNPGKTYACPMPGDLMNLPEDYRLPLKEIKGDMLKNHGYCRDVENGINCGIVTCQQGVFRFIPPAAREEDWQIQQLISDPVSDALLMDFDGDGDKELLTLSPFHGDTLRVYKLCGGSYKQIFEYEKKIEFAHAICAGNLQGKDVAIIGHRKGDRDLLAVSYENSGYHVELLDHDVGPANAMYMKVDGKDVIISANREINEIAYYTVE